MRSMPMQYIYIYNTHIYIYIRTNIHTYYQGYTHSVHLSIESSSYGQQVIVVPEATKYADRCGSEGLKP